MLIFQIENERYALESKKIVEVLPFLQLKKLHQTPEYIAGLLNYRSCIVPVIDLCQLIRGHPCCQHLSSRIMLINYLGKDGSNQICGLLAERVTQTLEISETELVDPVITVDNAPYLGKLITTESEMIQCLQVESLVVEMNANLSLIKY